MQPYSQCKPSIKNSELVDEKGQQAHLFATTPGFKQLVRDVSFRLGFNQSLEVELIIVIWDRCKYEQTWHPLEPSPWCVVSKIKGTFTTERKKINLHFRPVYRRFFHITTNTWNTTMK